VDDIEINIGRFIIGYCWVLIFVVNALIWFSVYSLLGVHIPEQLAPGLITIAIIADLLLCLPLWVFSLAARLKMDDENQ